MYILKTLGENMLIALIICLVILLIFFGLVVITAAMVTSWVSAIGTILWLGFVMFLCDIPKMYRHYKHQKGE